MCPWLIVAPDLKELAQGLRYDQLPTDEFSAGQQGLGYIYPARLAVLQLLQLPEDLNIFLEEEDDPESVNNWLAWFKRKAAPHRTCGSLE